MLILDVSAQLGAHSPDGTSNWKGLLGEGDGRIDLDWGDGVYSLHVEVDGLAAIFDLTGDFTFAEGKDIRFLAEEDVVVPNFVQLIGGDHLGGFGFFFDHEFQAPVSMTLARTWPCSTPSTATYIRWCGSPTTTRAVPGSCPRRSPCRPVEIPNCSANR